MAPNPLAPLMDAEKETIEGNEAEKEDNQINQEERIGNGENPARRNNLITRAQVPILLELDSDYSLGNDSPHRDMDNTSTSESSGAENREIMDLLRSIRKKETNRTQRIWWNRPRRSLRST